MSPEVCQKTQFVQESFKFQECIDNEEEQSRRLDDFLLFAVIRIDPILME